MRREMIAILATTTSDPSSRVTDGRASPAPPGVRRSRRDLADSAEDLASGGGGLAREANARGRAARQHRTDARERSRRIVRATEEGGGPSSASDEAPWVARWLAGRETPGDDTPDAHAGDVDGDAHRPSPPRRADADSGSTPTLTREPNGGDFTTNWFTHNADSLTAVFTRLGWMNDGTRARRVIEIGCWEGRSTQWLLCSLCRHADSVLYCVDTWRGGEQYADVGFDLGGEAHAGPAVEAQVRRERAFGHRRRPQRSGRRRGGRRGGRQGGRRTYLRRDESTDEDADKDPSARETRFVR